MNAPTARRTARVPAPGPRAHDTWPVIWRVVAPRAGNYNNDMVFIETDDEREARRHYFGLRSAGWPVRYERVQCGPLPTGAMARLEALRAAGAQNAGDDFPHVAGYWEPSAGTS